MCVYCMELARRTCNWESIYIYIVCVCVIWRNYRANLYVYGMQLSVYFIRFADTLMLIRVINAAFWERPQSGRLNSWIASPAHHQHNREFRNVYQPRAHNSPKWILINAVCVCVCAKPRLLYIFMPDVTHVYHNDHLSVKMRFFFQRTFVESCPTVKSVFSLCCRWTVKKQAGETRSISATIVFLCRIISTEKQSSYIVTESFAQGYGRLILTEFSLCRWSMRCFVVTMYRYVRITGVSAEEFEKFVSKYTYIYSSISWANQYLALERESPESEDGDEGKRTTEFAIIVN